MLNPLSFISKFIKSSNQKELDRLSKIVTKINDLEEKFINLENSDFPKKTTELKEKIKKGKTLDEILPEAFALVREASRRVRNERHFDVQLIGGLILNEGKIAEMKKLNEQIFSSIGETTVDMITFTKDKRILSLVVNENDLIPTAQGIHDQVF